MCKNFIHDVNLNISWVVCNISSSVCNINGIIIIITQVTRLSDDFIFDIIALKFFKLPVGKPQTQKNLLMLLIP